MRNRSAVRTGAGTRIHSSSAEPRSLGSAEAGPNSRAAIHSWTQRSEGPPVRRLLIAVLHAFDTRRLATRALRLGVHALEGRNVRIPFDESRRAPEARDRVAVQL